MKEKRTYTKYRRIENIEHKLCEYGCKKEAKFESGNKKWCCSDHWKKCPVSREKSKELTKGKSKGKKIENSESKLCIHGCKQIAKYQFGNGNLCCSENVNFCPVIRKKNGEKNKGRKLTKAKRIENPDRKLCDHDCGLIAKYQFGNGNLCCSENVQLCPTERKKTSEKGKGIPKTKAVKIKNLEHKLCDYGCNLEAQYKLGNGKLCCSESWNSCSINSKKTSEGNIGMSYDKSVKIENIEHKLCDYGCGQEAKFKLGNGKLCCSGTWNSCLFSRVKLGNSHKYSIKQWQAKYPTFTKEEEMRYQPKTGEIQVHCKNHNCKNSKEQDGWFTPTAGSITHRASQLEHPNGNDGGYFYCCDECKQECPLYNLKVDPFTNKKVHYTNEEYETFRQEVLKKDNNKCLYCGDKAEHVHHTRPQKLEPFFALDPDYGISVCENCHYKYGHKTGTKCSTGKLANVICV
jgi:hypothetical protein